MRNNTLISKEEVLTSTSNHEQGYKKHRIQLELENKDEQYIMDYFRTISAIASFIKRHGWHLDIHFSDTTDVKFTLNRNEKL